MPVRWPRTTLAREAWRRFRRHRLALASAAILFAMILGLLLGPLMWPVPINAIDFAAQLHGPSLAHPLGTDDLGQDLARPNDLRRPHLDGGRHHGHAGRRLRRRL